MFDHVTIRVGDRAASERFYDTVLATLGIDRTYSTPALSQWVNYQLTERDDAHPVTQRLHVGFAAPSREQVDDFWRTGVEAGYTDDGRPGPRPQYREITTGPSCSTLTATASRRSRTAGRAA